MTPTTAASRAQPSRRSLILLPPAPHPPTYSSIETSYKACLATVLRQIARSPGRGSDPVVLDIALPCPHLHGRLNEPRGPLYATTQNLVAGLYKLVCVLSAKDSIDTEDAEGVDARIVLVAYPRDGKLTHLSEEDATSELELQGPAVHLRTLARCSRDWDTVYSVECEEGEQLLRNFLPLGPSHRNVVKVRGGIVVVVPSSETPAEHVSASTNHLSVAVGGTFDHLHIGHKLLLTMFAFVLGRTPSSAPGELPSSLTIGITGDQLLKNKKYVEYMQSWQQRQHMVHEFLASILYFGASDDARVHAEEKNEAGPNGHAVHVTFPVSVVVKYVEIWDPFGPTITDESISALVISAETRKGGKAVNDKRAEKGWGPLEVFEVDVLDADEEGSATDETFQSKLSSTEIRRRRSERAQPTV